MATHGVKLEDAPAQLADRLALMKSLWTNDVGSHSGPYVSVEPSWSWPKPIQEGGPPIHLGARASKDGFADIAAWGDGWLPIENYGSIIKQIPTLRQAFEDAGRDPAEAKVSVYSSSGDPALIEQYEEAGVERVICWLTPDDEVSVLAQLEVLTKRLELG